MEGFRELGVEEEFLKSIEKLGFESPTPIQERVIPVILSGEEDLVALAQTGTGKTAAFGLPLLQRIDPDNRDIQVLILSPTRELCVQICNDLISYATNRREIKIAAVYGGVDIRRHIRTLEEGVHILVATPGRLCDLIRREALSIERVKFVVLDEADEMLNMGFKEDLNFILDETPEEKHTYLFSATMPYEVSRIAKRYLHNPQEITIGRKNSGADTVTHKYYQVMAKDCYETLRRLIDCDPDMYAIIFVRTKIDAHDIARKLQKDGIECDALHGDLSQAQRDDVMARFRGKLLKVLVATDVAARGLDVDNLTHVINYGLPEELEGYTHRSGRTGRAGKEGISLSIINSRETGKLRRIEKMLKREITYTPVPSGADVCRAQLHYYAGKISATERKDVLEPFVEEIFTMFEGVDKEELIRKVFAYEFGKILKRYSGAPDLNLRGASVAAGGRSELGAGRGVGAGRSELGTGRGVGAGRSELGGATAGNINSGDNPNGGAGFGKRGDGKKGRGGATFTTFSINVGRKDGFSPRSLMEIVNYCAPRKGMEIGAIRIFDGETKFEVDVTGVKNFPRYFSGLTFEDIPLKVRELEALEKHRTRRMVEEIWNADWRGAKSSSRSRRAKRQKNRDGSK